MTFYSCSFATILIRFYAMMFVGIAAVATGYYAIAVICLPLLLTCLLGVSFKKPSSVAVSHAAPAHKMAVHH